MMHDAHLIQSDVCVILIIASYIAKLCSTHSHSMFIKMV